VLIKERPLSVAAASPFAIFEARELGPGISSVRADDQRYLHLQKSVARGTTCIADVLPHFIVERRDVRGQQETASHTGDPSPFLLDMQGIGSLVHGRGLHFSDRQLRSLMLARGLLDQGYTYMKLGVSGAPLTPGPGGGEVLECAILSGRDGSGSSASVCGYIAAGEPYGSSIPLAAPNSHEESVERTAYSQSVWVPQVRPERERTLDLELRATENGASLLDAISTICDELGIRACGIQLCVSGGEQPPKGTVMGRVQVPEAPSGWQSLEDAAASGIEREFCLSAGQALYAVGTRYQRWEPEWTELTGRPYERRGHLHATIMGTQADWGQHRTFHLRDVRLGNDDVAHVQIYVAEFVHRIFPLELRGAEWVCRSSLRSVEQLAEWLDRVN